MDNKRILAPDFIKGVAIILMVYGHIIMIGSFKDIQRQAVDLIYTFHMPLFLVVSGFFFSMGKTSEFTERVTKLFKNIATPYFIFIFIYLVLLVLVAKFSNIPTNNKPPSSILKFAYNILIHPIGGYWFLHSLFIISFTFFFINKFFPYNKNSNLFLITLWLFFFLLSDVLHIVLLRTSFYFFLGFIISQFSNKTFITSYYTLFISLLILIFSVYNRPNIQTFSGYQILWVWAIFTFLWSMVSLMNNTNFVFFFAWIGRNTLIILVLHAFFIVLFKLVKIPILKVDPSGILYSIVVTIFTVLLSIQIERLFDILKLSPYLFNKKEIYSHFNVK